MIGTEHPRIHELKTWNHPFRAVADGVKTCEVRVNDRSFRVGDFLWLREYNPAADSYTGDSEVVEVTHIVQGGSFGTPDDMCVMSIALLPESAANMVLESV